MKAQDMPAVVFMGCGITTKFQRKIESFLFFQRLQSEWMDFNLLFILSKVKRCVMEKKRYLDVKVTFKG